MNRMAAIAVWVLASGSLLINSATTDRWDVVEQPDLKEQLEKAPRLQPEDLAIPAKSVMPWGTYTVPNPDGKTYDVLQWYIKEYRQKTRVYIADLGTGQVTLQTFPETEGKVRVEACAWVLVPDGRLFGATPDWSLWDKDGGMNIYVYDPAVNRVQFLKQIPHFGGEHNEMVLGPDGKLYGSGTYIRAGDHSQAGVFSLDPKTGEVRDYGPVGPRHDPNIAYGYWIGVDDTHIYVASGKIPWYLVAVNIRTGEQRILLEAPPGDYVNRMWIHPQYPGAWVMVQQGDEAPKKEYWLWHGQALPKAGTQPPWPETPSPLAQFPPAPEVYGGQLDPDAQGRAMLWVRPRGGEWKAIPLEGVETYPLRIHRLIRLPDGRFFGTAPGYQGRFLFDPRTGRVEALGRGGPSIYCLAVADGRLYWSGYASAPIDVFDWTRPWTLEKGGPPWEKAPAITSPESNPRRMADLFADTRVKKMMSAVVAGDGRIYFGGIGQRDYDGGGFGWYDPKSGEKGGLWRPFSAYRIYWLATALDGRYVVISTKTAEDELNQFREPEQAKVFVWDTQTKRIVREITPIPKGRVEKAGPLVEVAPGRMLGTTEDPEVPGGGLLYGLDVRTGAVLFVKKVPAALPFPWTQGTAQWDFQVGPDGFVWTTLGNVLVRIEPKDARVHVLGQLEPLGKFAFDGRDLYLAGAESIRRLRNIVPTGRGGVKSAIP